MKALTLWPEWAWAVRRLGKDVENRTWRPPSSVVEGTRIAIHAGATFGGGQLKGKFSVERVFDPVAQMARRAGWRVGYDVASNMIKAYSVEAPVVIQDRMLAIDQGYVVAVAEFDSLLVPGVDDPREWPWWVPEQFGWRLRNIRPLTNGVMCRGRQRLWRLPQDVRDAVVTRLGGA